ncbi:hypothetical protein AB4Y95_00240 [Arthrobacter sp. M-10]|uniref:hypothetical protein n=1 Tax=Arthrobacter sp. M-10 TaxID=3233037 RepID=UPI003F91F484
MITVKGVVTNGTTAAVTLFDNDVPNFRGLDSNGQTPIIELYGKWESNPPSGQPRPGKITLQPGENLNYTITSTTSNTTINQVKYWHTDAELGSFHASFDFDGPYWDCPDPLAADGKGGFSIQATNLPPVQ